MNKTTLIFLINNTVRALACSYEAHENAPVVIFKTLDPNLKPGDLVLVPTNTRHNMTVNKVIKEIHDFDPDTTMDVKWIIGPVDRTNYDRILGMENEAIAAVTGAEKRRKREELRKTLLADQESALAEMPIAQIGHTPTLATE